jgi:hypothetical protein
MGRDVRDGGAGGVRFLLDRLPRRRRLLRQQRHAGL